MRPLETHRLHLRPVGEEDAALYCRLYTDPDLMRHIATPLSSEAALRSFHIALKQQGGKRLLWVITEREVGVDLGILGVVPEIGSAEVGVMLFTQGQARGFAAEVISVIADALFQGSTIRRFWTRHALANGPAGVLMRNLGFEPLPIEGSATGNLPSGERRWQMTSERWQQCNRPAMAVARFSR